MAVSESRRHRLIWVAVAGVHLVALGAVWAGGGLPSAEPTREGGLLMISLAPDPVAVPGETKEGIALGAGAPLVVPSVRPLASSVPAPTAPSIAPSIAPTESAGRGHCGGRRWRLATGVGGYISFGLRVLTDPDSL